MQIKANIIIRELCENNILPKGQFQIQESHLVEFINTYKRFFSKKKTNILDTANYRFARKMAGVNLLKLLNDRGMKFNECNAGIVYLVSNIAYPKHYKVGMTMDLTRRLNQYQTYDPFKQFKVDHYEFVLDRKFIEKRILNSFNVVVESGEWIIKNQAIDVFFKECQNA